MARPATAVVRRPRRRQRGTDQQPVQELVRPWHKARLDPGRDGFIGDYYEYASSSFGGPPSFFYTAIEVLARMERWRHEGIHGIDLEHLAEFEHSYGLTLETLQSAYTSYAHERDRREEELIRMRDIATRRLDLPNTTVLPHTTRSTPLFRCTITTTPTSRSVTCSNMRVFRSSPPAC